MLLFLSHVDRFVKIVIYSQSVLFLISDMAEKNMLVLQYLSLGYHELKDKIFLKCIS